MHAIVNTMKLARPLPPELLLKIEQELIPRSRAVDPGLLGLKIVQVTETDYVMLAFYSSREALDTISSKVAGPWFAENVRSYLAGPVNRLVGEVVLDIKE